MEQLGVIPDFVGGLGNQIFIAAAAYVVSKIKNIPLYIFFNPISNNKHNFNKHNYNESIFKYIGKHIHMDVTNKNNFKIIGYKNFNHKYSFVPWNPEKVEPGSYLSGYFQYYPPIRSFENEFRQDLLKGLESIRKTIQVEPNSAFLHIRRGDYKQLPNYHFLMSIEYYESSIKYLLSKKEISRIYVISDEIEWVKTQSFFSNPLFKIYECTDELQTLALMTLCDEGAICANSTFSWWGAFLGAYAKRNPVIVPSNWIAEEVWNLFPEEWIII